MAKTTVIERGPVESDEDWGERFTDALQGFGEMHFTGIDRVVISEERSDTHRSLTIVSRGPLS